MAERFQKVSLPLAKSLAPSLGRRAADGVSTRAPACDPRYCPAFGNGDTPHYGL